MVIATTDWNSKRGKAFRPVTSPVLRGYDRATVAKAREQPQNPAEFHVARASDQTGLELSALGARGKYSPAKAMWADHDVPSTHRFASNQGLTVPADCPGLRATIACLTEIFLCRSQAMRVSNNAIVIRYD